MEVEAFNPGILHQILAPEGTTLPSVRRSPSCSRKGKRLPPRCRRLAGRRGSAAPRPPRRRACIAAPCCRRCWRPRLQYLAASNGHATDGRIKASPIARRMAQEFNLDIAAIAGRGPAGRVVKADVEAAIQAAQGAPAGAVSSGPAAAPVRPTGGQYAACPRRPPPAAVPEPALAASAGESAGRRPIQELTRIQLTTGRRLSESKQQAPHFYITAEVDMAEALALRTTLNEKAGGAFKISVNDLVIKAAAWALGRHPRLNSSFRDGKLYLFDHVHMSVAMAIDDGLVSPVLRNVDRKSLGQIARDSRALIEKARSGKLRPDDLSEGTFTISNLGMFDIDNFIAIINPPQAAILAVGAVRQVPVVRNGEIAVGQIMKATLSVDHRAADGAQAAQFLVDVRNALENPLVMAL